MDSQTENRKESYYQSKIMRWIRDNYPGAFIWKAAAGPYSRGGIPDICAVIDGKFYGFEVKRPGSEKKLTALQSKTLAAINKAGGFAGVVTSIDEAEEIIKGSRSVSARKAQTQN